MLDLWIEWYSDLAPEIGRELIASLSKLYPPLEGLRPDTSAEDLLARMKSGPSPLASIGAAAMMASLTDLVMHERADPKSWEQNEDLLEVLVQASDLSREDDEPFSDLVTSWTEHAKARAPFRQKQWARVAEGWLAMRRGPLSQAEMDLSRRRAQLPAHAPPPP